MFLLPPFCLDFPCLYLLHPFLTPSFLCVCLIYLRFSSGFSSFFSGLLSSCYSLFFFSFILSSSYFASFFCPLPPLCFLFFTPVLSLSPLSSPLPLPLFLSFPLFSSHFTLSLAILPLAFSHPFPPSSISVPSTITGAPADGS